MARRRSVSYRSRADKCQPKYLYSTRLSYRFLTSSSKIRAKSGKSRLTEELAALRHGARHDCMSHLLRGSILHMAWVLPELQKVAVYADIFLMNLVLPAT